MVISASPPAKTIMRLDKTQSSSFSGGGERSPAFMRLGGSMSGNLDYQSPHSAVDQCQASHDNSTESEEHPTHPNTPPPDTNGVSTGGGCPQENQHQGKELLNTVVQLPIEIVFNLLFMQEQFMVDVYSMKKTYDIVFGAWEEQEDGQRGRQVTYTMTLPSVNLGPKVSYVTEKQVILANSRPGSAYVVEVEATNGGIPYADYFTVASHYCLAKEDDVRTRLSVWVSIKYKKTPWGLVKTMIEKNTFSGVEGVLAEVVTNLRTEADRLAAPKGGRRRRRQMADKNHAGSKHATTPSHARGTATDGGEGTSRAVVVVAAALFVLAAGNAVLYLRLSRLEHHSGTPTPDVALPASKYLSVTGSWKMVAKLLQRQEEIHQNQLDEWRARLQQASTTLGEVQETLEMIAKSIPEHEEELRRVLEEQSAEVLAGWMQAEEALQQQLDDGNAEEHLSHPEVVSTNTAEMQDT
ncbi:GRAM domain-containing protein 1A [Chionoecetes opilio]|uniref:GRAM domain-containing protein 1A n=1 Tax=Chionoecetes opilio TaxID=41210 RepID=A0A8J5CLJ3_CHIOP|nr:GRAM domain-containing protein 1A [Chionoecetes opilio]